jgi:hypothetical protein
MNSCSLWEFVNVLKQISFQVSSCPGFLPLVIADRPGVCLLYILRDDGDRTAEGHFKDDISVPGLQNAQQHCLDHLKHHLKHHLSLDLSAISSCASGELLTNPYSTSNTTHMIKLFLQN